MSAHPTLLYTCVAPIDQLPWFEFRKEQTQRKPRKLDGDAQAFLVATVCSTPPTGLSVEKVAGFIDNLGVAVDINSALSLVFTNGAQGNISVVGNAPTWHEDITIWGEKGIFFMRNGKLEVCDEKGKRFTPAPEEMPQGSDPDKNFIAAILGREPIGVSTTMGLRVIELTEAAWESAASQQIAPVKH